MTQAAFSFIGTEIVAVSKSYRSYVNSDHNLAIDRCWRSQKSSTQPAKSNQASLHPYSSILYRRWAISTPMHPKELWTHSCFRNFDYWLACAIQQSRSEPVIWKRGFITVCHCYSARRNQGPPIRKPNLRNSNKPYLETRDTQVINAALLTSAWSAASSDLYTSSRALCE